MMSNLDDTLRNRCEGIMKLYNDVAVKEAFSTIIKLLSNIITKPSDQNMRLFKKTNRAIQTKILIIKEAIELMKEIGYKDLDSEFMVFEEQDTTALKKANRVLSDSIEILIKKLAEVEELKEVARQEEIKRQNEEIQKKFRDQKMRQLEIQKQMDNDKKEKLLKEKPSDSKGNNLEFGAKVCKFEPQQNKRG